MNRKAVINSCVSIRPFPYPYKAMLAICSDLDETPDLETYLEIVKYLNTPEVTRFGNGLGLEVGNSIYFDMPPKQFSYWNTDEKGREIIRSLIQSGHIDCLHSYGDLAVTRKHAERALDELSRYNCNLNVWVDHGTAPTNFGADIMRGTGDLPGSPAYHADLTFDYGIRYVWMGRVTSVLGQNTKRKLWGIFRFKSPFRSFKTMIKEYAKVTLAHFGNKKYAAHRGNKLCREVSLRDGHKAIEFIRSFPHWGGIEFSSTADGMGEVLSRRALDSLVKKNGVSIIYTHLGRSLLGPGKCYSQKTKRGFELLKEYYDKGKILVTTTSKLLTYCNMIASVGVDMKNENDWKILTLKGHFTLSEMRGLTIYTSEPSKVLVEINREEAKNIMKNPPDEKGLPSVSIPWEHLGYHHLIGLNQ